MARSTTSMKSLLIVAFLMVTGVLSIRQAEAQKLDDLSLERWAKLREVERYQLNIAEKYYREKNYKVAGNEYEKFLSLYEDSEGAPYSLMKWSLCLVEQKKPNTAISEGFQSVIDYWPESPEAVASAFYIGRAYKDMGEVRKAKKAHKDVVSKHGKHLVAVYSLVDLADLASIDMDVDGQVEAWRQLTFDISRTKESKTHCEQASQKLAAWCFRVGKLDDGVKSLATSYPPEQVPDRVRDYARAPIDELTRTDETREQGYMLTDKAVAWIRQQVPTGGSEAEKELGKNYWLLTSDLHAYSKRPEKVRETFEQTLKKFGVDDAILQRLGDWLKLQGEFDNARIEYAKFKNQLEGNNQIAYSFRQQKKYDLAVAAYTRNLSLDQDNQTKWNQQIAETWRDARKIPEAVAVYEALIAADPDRADSWMWNIAYTYHHYGGKYKEAIGWYRQCTNFPSNVQQMADCHRHQKEYSEAIGLYGQIIGGSPPTAPWALLQIGYTHEQAGSKEKAIQAFQQVCKRYPKDGHASVAHALLQDKYGISVTLGGAKDE
ncbi:MAG: tetratricopeptide repeat protein [Planctomycetota bacterium]|nr:tetratricopeptide repeat protein [Planctomycetota bacterium]